MNQTSQINAFSITCNTHANLKIDHGAITLYNNTDRILKQ